MRRAALSRDAGHGAGVSACRRTYLRQLKYLVQEIERIGLMPAAEAQRRAQARTRVVRAGVTVELGVDRWLRISAPNGSLPTGPGTNSYLLRAAGDDWVLIDPGPDDASHAAAILAELERRGARLCAILVTHTHIDHSPAAQAIAHATGARCIGRLADHASGQDARFHPDHVPADGERLDFGGGCMRCTRRGTPRTICAGCTRASACCSPATTRCRARR
jgi:glyoxylase-like metal-dependent hydrolase (beta-lactamase superfamily II)